MRREGQRILAASVFGRSTQLISLFQYLLDKSIAGKSPKESEIAVEVFGKAAEDLMMLDASVRVTLHRLRKKLAEFYDEEGAPTGDRLVMKRGEYRFILADMPPQAASGTAVSAHVARPRTSGSLVRLWGIGLLLVVAAATGYVLAGWRTETGPDSRLLELLPWSAIGERSPRVVIAIGGYYVVPAKGAEAADGGFTRIAGVNSDYDLDRLITDNPAQGGALAKFGFDVMPFGAATSLSALMPVVRQRLDDRQSALVAPMSKISAGNVVNNDLIYVGRFDGLGLLHDVVFAGSRFVPLKVPGELLDRHNGHIYRADPPQPVESEQVTKDYCLIKVLPGPRSGTVVILAGTSDNAMMQASELVTDYDRLSALMARLPGARGFEALYEVRSIGNRNVHAQLVAALPLTSFTWGGSPGEQPGPVGQASAPAASR